MNWGKIRLVIGTADKANEMGMEWWVNNPVLRQNPQKESALASLASLGEWLAALEDSLHQAIPSNP